MAIALGRQVDFATRCTARCHDRAAALQLKPRPFSCCSSDTRPLARVLLEQAPEAFKRSNDLPLLPSPNPSPGKRACLEVQRDRLVSICGPRQDVAFPLPLAAGRVATGRRLDIGGGAVPEIRRATRGTLPSPLGFPRLSQIPETGIARWLSLEIRDGIFYAEDLDRVADSQLYVPYGLVSSIFYYYYFAPTFSASMGKGSYVEGKAERQCSCWHQGLRTPRMELLLASRFV
ncbi:hypothetical protein J3F83DRAFT_740430 [Trichoderma novae-zelandiae]